MGQNAGYGGPVMCCITATDIDAIRECKDYIARFEYDRNQVKIIQKDGCTMVIALVRLW